MSKQSRSFGIGDLHLGHQKLCAPDADGKRLRPFNTTDEMDERIIELWNETVNPQDRVYLVGDATLNRRHLHKLGRLQGRKILVKGNHDVFRLDEYAQYFEDIRGSHLYSDAILTHIPIHPNQLKRFPFNIHGHTHNKRVLRNTTLPLEHDDVENWGGLYEDDPRYICISAEQTDYRPVLLDEVLHRAKTFLQQ